ncbi:hypothetical protein EJ08DRAFT_683934 [Tothia fuscella]|uniref:Uncharacterized protein n=1 Tax=Tothia fuscella TaxID=1048955 RepID=A0A9P4NER0_9PEZI|nr:hypothetical protein EJ08DRAFT_683934 [Tothia fuscella]
MPTSRQNRGRSDPPDITFSAIAEVQFAENDITDSRKLQHLHPNTRKWLQDHLQKKAIVDDSTDLMIPPPRDREAPLLIVRLPTRRQRKRMEALAAQQDEERKVIEAEFWEDHAATLRITRQQVADLKEVAYVECADVKRYIEQAKKEGIRSPNEAPDSNADGSRPSSDLAQSHSLDSLAEQGFTQEQARSIQNQILKEQTQRVSVYSDKHMDFDLTSKARIERHIAEGWRPEHNAIINTLQKKNEWLKSKIPQWQSDEFLVSYFHEILDAGLSSDNALELRKKLSTSDRRLADYLVDDEAAIASFLQQREEERKDALENKDKNTKRLLKQMKIRHRQSTGQVKGSNTKSTGKRGSLSLEEVDSLSQGLEDGSLGDAWPEERFIWERNKNRHDYNSAENSHEQGTKSKVFENWWNKSHEIHTNKDTMIALPLPPCGVCFTKVCRDSAKSSLNLCEHTLRTWYQRSDNYGEALKLDMRRFHPDRFHKCVEHVREDIVKEATVFFQMLGLLVAREEE